MNLFTSLATAMSAVLCVALFGCNKPEPAGLRLNDDSQGVLGGRAVQTPADIEEQVVIQRQLISDGRQLILEIPSYSNTHSAVITDAVVIQSLSDQFQAKSAAIRSGPSDVGAGGSSIRISSSSRPEWALIVGDGWAISQRLSADGTRVVVVFELSDDDYLALCAIKAGFAYPLLSDVYGNDLEPVSGGRPGQ